MSVKGLISGIKRMEIHDGEGLRTTVFFKGCPLRCVWCHNPESLSYERQVAFFAGKCIGCGACGGERTERAASGCPVGALVAYGKEYDAEELADLLCADAPFFGETGGVTLSGGECLSQPAFAVALAKCLRERGVSVYVDTCGFVARGALEAMLPYTDRFLYDLKAIDPNTHKRFTGVSNELILENLRRLDSLGATIEIRIPYVPECNGEEIEKMAELLSSLQNIKRVRVLPYHNLAGSKYEALGIVNTLPDRLPTDKEVERAREIIREKADIECL